MVDFAHDSRVKDPAVPIDLAGVGGILFSLVLDKALHGDLSWLEIPNGKDSLSSSRSISELISPWLLFMLI